MTQLTNSGELCLRFPLNNARRDATNAKVPGPTRRVKFAPKK